MVSPRSAFRSSWASTNAKPKSLSTHTLRSMPVCRRYIDRTLEETRKEQSVKTLFGRTRPIPDINSKNANMRGFAERTAVNTPLQGTAADLIKLAMIQIDEELRSRKLKSRMLLQVHDDLLFEVPQNEIELMRGLVREKMENVYKLNVPLLVDLGVGPNWRDKAVPAVHGPSVP